MAEPHRLELTWSGGQYRVSTPNYLREGERRRLIEADFVLDLLERPLPMDGKPRSGVDRETVALLRTCGRRP